VQANIFQRGQLNARGDGIQVRRRVSVGRVLILRGLGEHEGAVRRGDHGVRIVAILGAAVRFRGIQAAPVHHRDPAKYSGVLTARAHMRPGDLPRGESGCHLLARRSRDAPVLVPALHIVEVRQPYERIGEASARDLGSVRGQRDEGALLGIVRHRSLQHPPVRDGTESFGIVGRALDEDSVGQVEEGADLPILVAEILGDGNVAVDRRHGQRDAGALKAVRGEVHLISPRFGSVLVPSQAQEVEILNAIRLVSRVTDDNDGPRHA